MGNSLLGLGVAFIQLASGPTVASCQQDPRDITIRASTQTSVVRCGFVDRTSDPEHVPPSRDRLLRRIRHEIPNRVVSRLRSTARPRPRLD